MLHEAPPSHFYKILAYRLHRQRDTTYPATRDPYFAVGATSVLGWAVWEIVVRIAGLRQLALAREKLLATVIAWLITWVSASTKTLRKNHTHRGGGRGGEEKYNCLNLHGDGFGKSNDVCLVGFRVTNNENEWDGRTIKLFLSKLNKVVLTICGPHCLTSALI